MHLLLGDVDGEAVHVVLDVAVGAVVEEGARRLVAALLGRHVERRLVARVLRVRLEG